MATLADRLGLPNMTGRGRLLAAVGIDALGSGLFLPFAVVYFLHTTTLTLTGVGLGLSVAGALALPTSLIVGPLVDRLGAKRVVVASNLVQAASFTGYLFVSTLWQLIGFALLTAIGQGIFWTANGALTSLAADGGQRARWFGLQQALRNAGFGIGGLLAAIAVTTGGPFGYRFLAGFNASSYLIAGMLTASWRSSRSSRQETPDRETARPSADSQARPRATYRQVLADRPFLLLMATNLLFVFSDLMLTVLLAIYILRDLHGPAWLVGVLFATNSALVAASQTTIAGRTEHRRRTGVLRAAAGLWACTFALLWALSAAPHWLVIPGLFAAIVVATSAEVLNGPTMRDLVSAMAPTTLQGRYFAIHRLSWSVGGTVAPFLFTSLLARGAAWPWVFLLAGSTLAITALVYLARALPHHIEHPSHAEPPQDYL